MTLSRNDDKGKDMGMEERILKGWVYKENQL